MRRVIKWVLVILVVSPLLIWVTGNNHVYKTVRLTLGKGSLKPSLYEYKDFPGRLVKAGEHEPWALSSRYNVGTLPPDVREYAESFNTLAYLVIQNDSIVYEEYWDESNDTAWTNSFSMAKSVVSMAVGAAIQDGLLKDLDTPVANYLDFYDTDKNRSVTLRHLLTMSSGMNYGESYINPFGFVAKLNYGDDLDGLLAKYELREEPGKTFRYRGGDVQAMAMVMDNITGQKLSNYFADRVWSKIGARRDALWSLDSENGREKASCCFQSNARDFARLGKLMMQNGNWKGEQLIDSAFIARSIKPNGLNEWTGKKTDRYGYYWWIMNRSGMKVFYARGILGQYIFCIPEKNIIAVRLGHRRSAKRKSGHPVDAFTYIDTALELCK